MPDYGYNPAQYLNDFSWIKDIGNSISKFAYQVPELIELNKQIKENNKSKDLIYSSVNRYFDKLDPKVVSNIASSMNLGLDPNSPTFDKDARAALKKTIPTFTNNTKNEDYANHVVSSFIPVIRAAQSNAGGGALSFGDLLSGIEDERVYEGVKASTYGKEQTANEQYKQGFERKYGTGGEMETAGKLETAESLDRAKQTSQFNREQGQGDADAAQEILAKYKSGDPETIYSDPAFREYSAEAKQMAYKIASDTTNRDLKEELQNIRLQYQKDLKDKENLPKIYDQTQLETKLMDVRSKISEWSNKLKSFKKDQKGQPEYTTIEQNIEQAKLTERAYQGALKYLSSNPKATQEQVNTSMAVARQNINPEDEQKFISDWQNNRYGTKGLGVLNPFAIGQEDDLIRFKKAYSQRFGMEPKVEKTKDDKGKTIFTIIPQQGTVKDVTRTTDSLTTTQPSGSQSTELASTLAALKAELERRKQQGK